MRMHKKKNLEARLASCGPYLIECRNQNLNQQLVNDEQHLIDFPSLFGNSNPLTLEIGCGQGSFACDYARLHPERNLIAVEQVSNVIITGCERAKQERLPNLVFLLCGAEYLPSYIPPASVSALYLNFSCPYPKSGYARHRLTHPRFLQIYTSLMAPGATLYQKTDNAPFFEYSVEQLSQFGFTLNHLSLDLHHSPYNDANIETEYERRFTSQGLPIYYLEASEPREAANCKI